MRLEVCHVELKQANAFVAATHRHHAPVVGHRYSVGATYDGALVGVAIAGRPVARGLDARSIVEVTRCCTVGTRNACSFLYTRIARVAAELGYRAVITYTLADEEGASLRACGWWPEVLEERDTAWACASRPRSLTKGQGLGQKIRWVWLTGVGA